MDLGYLRGKQVSFIDLPTRNFNVVFAGIWIVSPVAGFLPSRAFLSDLTSFPNPGSTNSPFDLTSLAARVDNSSKKSFIWARFIPVLSAKWLITSDCVMRFLPVAALVAMVWSDTSNKNLEWKSYPDTHISHSSSKVSKKSRYFAGLCKPNQHPAALWEGPLSFGRGKFAPAQPRSSPGGRSPNLSFGASIAQTQSSPGTKPNQPPINADI